MIPGPMRSMRANSWAVTNGLSPSVRRKITSGRMRMASDKAADVIGAAVGLDRAEKLLDLRPIGIGAEGQLAVGPRRIERLGALVVDHELELVHVVDLFDAGQDFRLGRGQQFALGAARSVQNVDELRPLGLHPEERDLGLLARRSQQHLAAGVVAFRARRPGVPGRSRSRCVPGSGGSKGSAEQHGALPSVDGLKTCEVRRSVRQLRPSQPSVILSLELTRLARPSTAQSPYAYQRGMPIIERVFFFVRSQNLADRQVSPSHVAS